MITEKSPVNGKSFEHLLYSEEAEKAVLGCMICQPNEVMEVVLDNLREEDFFVPALQDIFSAMSELHKKSMAIDTMTVHQGLIDGKKDKRCGSPGILAEIMVGFATHLNVSSYIQIVKDKSTLRQLQSACVATIRDITDYADETLSVVDRAEARFTRIGAARIDNSIYGAWECMAMFHEQLMQIEDNASHVRIQSGIVALDEVNGGLPAPGYVVFGAAPGVGKTAIALTMMKFWCEQNIGVGMFSLEMTVTQLMKRLISSKSEIDSRLLNKKLHQADKEDVGRAAQEISRWPFWIDETAYLTAMDLRGRARQMVKSGAKIIILDYIQLMKGMDRREKPHERLTEISRHIKILSKELGVLFIVLAQINREGAKSPELRLEHLAECAAMGQDADCVFLMWLKEGAGSYAASEIPVHLKFAKYRDGLSRDRIIDIRLDSTHQKFY